LGRFAQADTIIPSPGNSQVWDRFACTLNNPLKYTDPGGHNPECGPDGIFCEGKAKNDFNHTFVVFKAQDGQSWTDEEKKTIQTEVAKIAFALAWEYAMRGTQFTPSQAFNRVFGGYIVAKRVNSEGNGWAEHQGKVNGHYTINFFSSTTANDITGHPRLVVHEVGHALIAALGINGDNYPTDLYRPVNSDGIVGREWVNGVINYFGFYGGHYDWQFGKQYVENAQYKEEIADMFVGWVYNRWENSDFGRERKGFMHDLITDYLP